MRVKRHFQIQPHEFRQVTMCITVFSPKNCKHNNSFTLAKLHLIWKLVGKMIKEFLEPEPIVYTFSKSEAIAICLYSWGLCAKYAEVLKYDTVNTLAPPSLAAEIIFGV